MPTSRHAFARIAVVLITLTAPATVRAACDVIPGRTPSFRGAQGTIDHPFASPGDFVTMSQGTTCGEAAGSFSSHLGDQIVTIVFMPPKGPNNVVVLAADCQAIHGRRACADEPLHVRVHCIDGREAGLMTRDSERGVLMQFRFPDTTRLSKKHALRLPDGPSPPPSVHKAFTFTGPAAIAVSPTADDVPCDLVNGGCGAHPGLLACVDQIYADDGTCGSTPDPVFEHFTALPFPNDYSALCTPEGPACTGRTGALNAALDSVGNLLIPMDWTGVLVRARDDPHSGNESGTQSSFRLPDARIVRASVTAEAFPGTGVPITWRDDERLASFSPDGRKLPPIFTPLQDANPQIPGVATLFGTVDARRTVLRVARYTCAGGPSNGKPCNRETAGECDGGTCAPAQCISGAQQGRPCNNISECPGSVCERGAFDLTNRPVRGVGPVVFSMGMCAGITPPQSCARDADCPLGTACDVMATALDPIELDGVLESNETFAFVNAETIAHQDLNGDSDETDDVVTLRDHVSGATENIGENGASGRAITRIIDGQPRQLPVCVTDNVSEDPVITLPFTLSGVALERDIAAILEFEPTQFGNDLNGNGRIFDSILRVFRVRRNNTALELTDPQHPITVDAAPAVNGRSVVVSGGSVYFRSRASEMLHESTALVSADPRGAYGNGDAKAVAVSGDGGTIVFISNATNLTADASDRKQHVFVWHGAAIQRVDVGTDQFGQSLDGDSVAALSGVAISDDGRFVAFVGSSGLFLRDRGTTDVPPSTTRITSEVSGSHPFAMSRTGRFITFASFGANIAAAVDATDGASIFVHDNMCNGIPTGTCVCTSRSDGSCTWLVPHSSHGRRPTISANGRFIAFGTCPPSDYYCLFDVAASRLFLYDRESDADPQVVAPLVLSSTPPLPSPVYNALAISGDGRFVMFNAVKQFELDTDLRVYDRDSGTIRTIKPVGPDGNVLIAIDRPGASVDGLSDDGRYAIVESDRDVYLRDQLTGAIERIGPAQPTGIFGAGTNTFMSVDGRVIAYVSKEALPGDVDVVCREGIGVCSNDLRRQCLDDTNCGSGAACLGNSHPCANVFIRTDSGSSTAGTAVLHALVVTPDDKTTAVALGPTETAVIVGDAAAFIAPADHTIHLSQQGRAAESLGRSASKIAMGGFCVGGKTSGACQVAADCRDPNAQCEAAWLAAITPADGKSFGTVAVHRIGDAPDSWMDIGHVADTVQVSGPIVAFLTPEAGEGADLNGDSDLDDRVLQIWDAEHAHLVDLTDNGQQQRQQADEFVLGASILAFRTSEAAQGAHDLNGDDDNEDRVLQVYRLTFDERELLHAQLFRSGQAATPCTFEACDPLVPYRVQGDTVTFLTLECDQGGQDLNHDEDHNGIVLQLFNVRAAEAAATAAPSSATSLGAAVQGRVRNTATATTIDAAVTVLAGTTAGICTTTGRACVDDESCHPGKCIVPPGRCNVDTHKDCQDCEAGEVCEGSATTSPVPVPTPPTAVATPIVSEAEMGTCHRIGGLCQTQADCGAADATCVKTGIQRLVAPLSKRESRATRQVRAAGAKVLVGVGHCVEHSAQECTDSGRCRRGWSCGPRFFCEREHGSCASDADCPHDAPCQKDLVTITAEDSDGDEVPDVVDNCPHVPNAGQVDGNGDGVGDECDATLDNCVRTTALASLACGIQLLDARTADSTIDARVRRRLAETLRRAQRGLAEAEEPSSRRSGLRHARSALTRFERQLGHATVHGLTSDAVRARLADGAREIRIDTRRVR